MTNKQALREAAEKATPGKWRRASTRFNGITAQSAYPLCGKEDILANAAEKRDAEYIAAANPATVLALLDELEAAEKRVAELEAVKFKLSDSKLLLLAKDIVENLVDTGSSEPEYTQQYLDWTCKRIRAAGRINGEGGYGS